MLKKHAASYMDEDDDDEAPTNLSLHDCASKGLLRLLSKLLKHNKHYKVDDLQYAVQRQKVWTF